MNNLAELNETKKEMRVKNIQASIEDLRFCAQNSSEASKQREEVLKTLFFQLDYILLFVK
jgi:hypothetical protein